MIRLKPPVESSSESEEFTDSDDELREMLAQGKLKPGLNVELSEVKQKVNDVIGLRRKAEEIALKLDWIERMDMVNDLAPLAPELAIQLEQQEQKRANMFAGNAKLKYVEPDKDPVLNDFKREMLFHRQAQAAVTDGIKKLHALGIKTKRPDDYFAEMAKTDVHMQKVRKHLMAKQEGQARSEKVRQIREQKKMGKKMQQQARVKKEMEKKETLDQLKKFRKGKLKNLDFLDDKKGGKKNAILSANRSAKNKKFGFGGKKRGNKRNDKKSSMSLGGGKNKGGAGGGGKRGGPGGGGRAGGGNKSIRPGKNNRAKAKFNKRK